MNKPVLSFFSTAGEAGFLSPNGLSVVIGFSPGICAEELSQFAPLGLSVAFVAGCADGLGFSEGPEAFAVLEVGAEGWGVAGLTWFCGAGAAAEAGGPVRCD